VDRIQALLLQLPEDCTLMQQAVDCKGLTAPARALLLPPLLHGLLMHCPLLLMLPLVPLA
jgi:hypothetical protein